MMRPLFYEFPSDKRSWDVSTQYMFGSKYLVCPVLKAGKRKMKVYLPPLQEGSKWFDYDGKTSFEGGQQVEAECPLGYMPVFVRNA